MLQFFKTRTIFKLSVALLVIWALGALNLLVTSWVSKSYRHATEAVYASEQIKSAFAGVNSLLLYSTGFEGLGEYSCSTFSFIVRGTELSGVAHVQVRQENQSAPFVVTEIVLGIGSEFERGCKDRNIRTTTSNS
jgi:hypothetical protein